MAYDKIPIGDTYLNRIVIGHGSEIGNKTSSVTEKQKRFWNPLKWNLEIERVLLLIFKEVTRNEKMPPTTEGTQDELVEQKK